MRVVGLSFSMDLKDLRALVAARHDAATRKVSRIKSATGAQVSGTEFDPRTSKSRIKKYTRKQLASYMARLDRFNDRSNQFVSDASRNPIPRSEFREYKRREAQFNKVVSDNLDRYKDVYIPASGQTVGERIAMTTPTHRHMTDTGVNRPLPIDRKPEQIASRKALQKMVRDLKKKGTKTWVRREIKRGQDELTKMLDVVGSDPLMKAIGKLTPDQFNIVWNYTNFATRASLVYEVEQRKLKGGNPSAFLDDTYDTQLKEMMDIVSWAKNLKLGR